MMHVQICEYCRSRVERGREDCKNCGAPVDRAALDNEMLDYLSMVFYPGKHKILCSGQAVWTQDQQANYGNIQRNDCGNIVGRR